MTLNHENHERIKGFNSYRVVRVDMCGREWFGDDLELLEHAEAYYAARKLWDTCKGLRYVAVVNERTGVSVIPAYCSVWNPSGDGESRECRPITE